VELLIPLDSGNSMPMYEQIYHYIKNEIRNGNLKTRQKLPSSRELAKSLKVSRSTTQLAYEQLVSEGYLEAVPRKGYFTAGLEGIFPPISESKVNANLQEPGEPFSEYHEMENEIDIDFSLRGIDLDSFPFSTWRKISRSVLKEERREILLKGDPQGDRQLREAIRDYLHGARGVNCSADQIVVGAGNEYLLMLLSQLIGTDTGIAMESPTYEQAYRVLTGMGNPVYPVGVDQSGFMVSELEHLPVDVAYVMPSHQFPMGIVMPVKRRQELLLWAGEKDGRYLIEDDYDSEFRYKGKPIPALQGMDTKGRVIYMGTFSRAIAPAIRVGYLVLPESLMKKYWEQARFYSSTVSRVDQKILAGFLQGGFFERHLNRMREVYKWKHDRLLAALKPLEERFEIRGEYAGLHILLSAKGNVTEKELVEAAADEGIRVYGLSDFFIHRDEVREDKTVLLGYAKLDEDKIQTGAERLCEIYSKFTRL